MESKTRIKDIDYNSFFYATTCHVCKRFGDGVNLKACSGCNLISYCSTEHQKQHWKEHLSLCAAVMCVLTCGTEKFHEILDYRNQKRFKFMQLMENILERSLKKYEKQMFIFPRECAVCHELTGKLLKDCENCAASYCTKHVDGTEHKDICVTLELCFRFNFVTASEEHDYMSHINYLHQISNTHTFHDINDFINIYGNVQTQLKMSSVRVENSYEMSKMVQSEYLSYPLTLFHAMRVLDYVPKRKTLVIHIIGSTIVEMTTLQTWRAFINLTDTSSLLIIMIGQYLKFVQSPIWFTSGQKKYSVEFHCELYENYVRGPSFVKPDLVLGYHVNIHKSGPFAESWSAPIQLLAKQNCPFVLTCFTELQSKLNIERINSILKRKVKYLYGGKNPFASLIPHRYPDTEKIMYENHYIIVYRSLGL